MKINTSLFLCLIVFCVGCSTNHLASKKSEFVLAYKQMAQFAYLDAISDGKFKTILRAKQDASLVPQAEILGEYYYQQADSIARKKAIQIGPILPDETDDFFSRKAYFNQYLLFSSSKFLDSLAKKSFIEYKKQLNQSSRSTH